MQAKSHRPIDPPGGEPMPFSRLIKRSLTRRFPRLRRAYDELRWRVPHLVWRLVGAPVRRILGIVPTLRWIARSLSAWHLRRMESRLTVAVDIASFWEPLTGIGWYLYRILEHLSSRDDIRVRLYAPSVVDSPDLAEPTVTLPSGPAIERVQLHVPDNLFLPSGWIVRILRRLEPLLIAADGNQVLFAPNYFLPRRFALSGGALVATIHDLGFRKVAWTLQEETLRDLTGTLEPTLFNATRLITVSGAVRDELVELGYASASRVHVIHHGPGQLASVDPTELPEGTPDSFALHVGTIEPRKNISTLLEAWRILVRQEPSVPKLVLCGKFGWKTERLRRQVEAAQCEGWLFHPGYVTEGELAALYKEAQVVVFPSLYEGFGLPSLEALLAGTPLVCSDLPVMREVVGDAALFAPFDQPELLAGQVREALKPGPQRDELIETGRRRALEFSWSLAAQKTVEAWQAAAEVLPLAKSDIAPAELLP